MVSTVIGRSLASVCASDVWSNPRQIPGTTMNSVSSWFVTKRSSLSPPDGQHRILDSTQTSECHHHHHRLQRGRQLPGHHRPGGHSVFGEGRRGSRCRVTKLRTGEAAAEIIDEHHPSWVLVSCRFDELPVGLCHGGHCHLLGNEQSALGQYVAHHLRAASGHRVGARPQPALSQTLFRLLHSRIGLVADHHGSQFGTVGRHAVIGLGEAQFRDRPVPDLFVLRRSSVRRGRR